MVMIFVDQNWYCAVGDIHSNLVDVYCVSYSLVYCAAICNLYCSLTNVTVDSSNLWSRSVEMQRFPALVSVVTHGRRLFTLPFASIQNPWHINRVFARNCRQQLYHNAIEMLLLVLNLPTNCNRNKQCSMVTKCHAMLQFVMGAHWWWLVLYLWHHTWFSHHHGINISLMRDRPSCMSLLNTDLAVAPLSLASPGILALQIFAWLIDCITRKILC